MGSILLLVARDEQFVESSTDEENNKKTKSRKLKLFSVFIELYLISNKSEYKLIIVFFLCRAGDVSSVLMLFFEKMLTKNKTICHWKTKNICL